MSIKFFLAQFETYLGDLEGNFSKLKKYYEKAEKSKSDLLLTTELALSGYPPKDLLFKEDFREKIGFYIEKFKKITKGKKCILGLGTPFYCKNIIYNSFLLIKNNKILQRIDKTVLPNFGVFDEKRYFINNLDQKKIFKFRNRKILFFICEDFWNDQYIENILEEKPDLIVVINASPYEINKFEKRILRAKKIIKTIKKPILYLNCVGTQDDLLFDGGSFILGQNSKLLNEVTFFKEKNFEFLYNSIKKQSEYKVPKKNLDYEIYEAIVFSLRGYLKKNKFKSVIVGISGGIDSALVAAIACDAIGPERVLGFMLPSKYTSQKSLDDSMNLSKKLGFELKNIKIEKLKLLYLQNLKKLFGDLPLDITEENLQSRIRGNILMAISNKFKSILLATGNKSELAVGYSTLYGDMCGGFSPLKDLYKTQVFKLSRWRNTNFINSSKVKKTHVIPNSIIIKEPTAELKENQKDTDTLPPYELLDKILYLLIEKNMSKKEMIKQGYDKKLIETIWFMIKNSEFKRYQSSLGPKLSQMCFDNDRRFPIINNFEI